MREGIADGMAKAEGDHRVRAIVICGRGKTFSVGADIKEFAELRKGREVFLYLHLSYVIRCVQLI